MCKLAEGRDGCHYPRIATAVTIFFLFSSNVVSAQDTLSDIWVSIVEMLAEQGADEESIQQAQDWYEQLIIKPLDLSRATRADLGRFGLLSPFQIESFMDYRAKYGTPLSFSELSMIDGFDRRTVNLLSRLVKLGNSFDSSDKGSKTFDSQLRTRFKSKLNNSIPYRYLGYSTEYGKLSANITLESDIGESWLPDFYSANIKYENDKTKFILGDYIVQSGQGLALWKGFSLSSLASPASLMKTGSNILPYRSADEFGYFRGLAASFSLSKNICLMTFASARPVDAKVEDNTYKTLPSTGLHVSDNELAARHSMLEYSAGVAARANGDRFTIGFTALTYTFNKINERPVKAYNLYQMYDGYAGNISIDAAITLRHIRIFGETAISLHRPSNLAFAFAQNNINQLLTNSIYTSPLASLAGATYSPSGNFELAILLRYYSPTYVAPHSGAYSSTSSRSNQIGVMLSALWRHSNGISFESSFDFSHNPWFKYPSIPPSNILKYRFKQEYVNDYIIMLLQNYTTYSQCDKIVKNSPKISLKYLFSNHIKMSGTCYGSFVIQDRICAKGYGVSLNLQLSMLGNDIVADSGLLLFNTDGYSSRIYVYQNDLPQSFSIGMYQGVGSSAYMVLRCKVGRRAKLSLKGAGTFFDDGRDDVYDLKLQADFSF